eukprot:gene8245-biopygen1574
MEKDNSRSKDAPLRSKKSAPPLPGGRAGRRVSRRHVAMLRAAQAAPPPTPSPTAPPRGTVRRKEGNPDAAGGRANDN